MLMTIAEAQVVQEKWATLRQAFAQSQAMRPAALRAGFLIQDNANPTLWRIVGIWESRASFDAYKQSVETPGAMTMFRAAGAEPTVSLFDIADRFSV
jgi:quinol monooxygenase YgiN